LKRFEERKVLEGGGSWKFNYPVPTAEEQEEAEAEAEAEEVAAVAGPDSE